MLPEQHFHHKHEIFFVLMIKSEIGVESSYTPCYQCELITFWAWDSTYNHQGLGLGWSLFCGNVLGTLRLFSPWSLELHVCLTSHLTYVATR